MQTFSVSLDKTVTREGVNQIMGLLESVTDCKFDESIFNGLELVNRFGKITKRIKNNVWKIYNVKVDSAILSEIGNIANMHTVNGDYTLTIDSDMDIWSEDYSAELVTNDNGTRSCFSPGGCYRNHWEAMQNSADFYAVRVYQDGKWIGRAWYNDHGYDPIVFNGYGLQLRQIAILLSKALGMDYKQISIDSDIYINGDTGFVFGDARHSHHSIYAGIGIKCEDCGYNAGEDDSCYVESRDGYICYDCMWQYHTCEGCNEIYHGDDVVGDESGNVFCNSCYGYHYTICDNCDCEVERNETWETPDGNDVCSGCYNELVKTCDVCNYDFMRDETGGDTCKECKENED